MEVKGERHWGKTPQRSAPADALWTQTNATEERHSGTEERRDTEDTEKRHWGEADERH